MKKLFTIISMLTISVSLLSGYGMSKKEMQ